MIFGTRDRHRYAPAPITLLDKVSPSGNYLIKAPLERGTNIYKQFYRSQKGVLRNKNFYNINLYGLACQPNHHCVPVVKRHWMFLIPSHELATYPHRSGNEGIDTFIGFVFDSFI